MCRFSPRRTLLAAFCVSVTLSEAFAPLVPSQLFYQPSQLAAQRKSSDTIAVEEDEALAPVAGSEFFGGNKQKEELYDPIAEAQADVLILGDRDEKEQEEQVYSRFSDEKAFGDEAARAVAMSLQQQLNSILYEDAESAPSRYAYSPNVQWTSPFGKSAPLQELQKALDFYNRVDVAITSARSLSPTSVQVRWEISLLWPIFWEARVVLTGTSQLLLDGSTTIVQQVDTLDQSDMFATIAKQVLPRFWDTYHIGMTPSAELQPTLAASKALLARYNLYRIPPRLVYAPSLLDTGSREDANAQTVPNHAFATVIKTMGPKKQRYVPTSPIQVQFEKTGSSNKLQWSLPISVELQTGARLPLPGHDSETSPNVQPESRYEFQSDRWVAALAYGGCPQDAEVVEVRKRLYQQIVRDGLEPKLDESGRPQFFFWQHDVRACYTEGGLGMAVYDWRPKFAKANEVGIELESPVDLTKK